VVLLQQRQQQQLAGVAEALEGCRLCGRCRSPYHRRLLLLLLLLVVCNRMNLKISSSCIQGWGGSGAQHRMLELAGPLSSSVQLG
jgi:hypothetical protein